MARIIVFLSLLITFLPASALAQNKQADIRQQRLLLNLAWGFLYIARQNQIGKDSILALCTHQLKIDPLILITQNDEVPFYANKNFTNSKEEISFLKMQLPKYSGKENTRLLNSIGWMYIFKQGNLHNNLDSAWKLLTIAKQQASTMQDDKGFNESLCYLGLYYYKNDNLKSGDSCLLTAASQCKKTGNKIGEALALCYKGIYYPYGQGPFSVRIDCLKRALTLYQQLNDKEAQAITLINIAYLLIITNELSESQKLTVESLQLQKEIGFPFTHYTTDLLALISVIGGNHGNYLQYSLESVKVMEATNDTIASPYFYARVGDAYAEMENKKEECVKWYIKALDKFKKNGGDLSMYKLLANLTNTMEQLGRSREAISLIESTMKQYPPINAMDKQNLLIALGGAYFKIGQTAISGKYYEQAEKLQPAVEAVSGNVATGFIYYTIGFYYFHIKQYEKSRGYFMKILNGKQLTGVALVSTVNIHMAMFTIDSAAGHFNDAIKHLKEYSRLNDSVYSEKQSKQMQEWDIFYKTEKKEKELQLLAKENQVKELSLKKAMLTRNVIIASSVLLLALLFTGYSLKQRHNKKLQMQQKEINGQNQLLKEFLAAQQKLVEEKEWLVKEIHHRVKNNLQMIISLLNAQSEFLDHPSALNAIKESRERMQAVALIHQKLYQPDQGTFINMHAYIQEMVGYLGSSFADVERISFLLDIEDINLDVSQALPLGLILNEAITNAVKYAFPPQQHGTVNILLNYINTGNILLKIKDNGRGFPDNFDFSNNNSLGIQLIQLFAEQLEGDLQFKSIDGVEISLTFKQFYPENKTPYLINSPQTDGRNSNS